MLIDIWIANVFSHFIHCLLRLLGFYCHGVVGISYFFNVKQGVVQWVYKVSGVLHEQVLEVCCAALPIMVTNTINMCPSHIYFTKFVKMVDLILNFLATKQSQEGHKETRGGVRYISYLGCGNHITVFAYV